MSPTIRISREHFVQSSGSASHTFLISFRNFAEGMRQGLCSETSLTCRALPAAWASSSARLLRSPPHLIRVPAVADEWGALVRDLLGYRRYEPAQVEDLEVALDLRVQAGAVDDRPLGVGAVRLRDLHLFDGKGITNEVLGEALQVFAPVGQNAAAAMAKPCRMTTVLRLHTLPRDSIEN